MKIKKIRTLVLILILSFPMLYLPLSVNSAIVPTSKDDPTKNYNPYNLNTVETIEYSDGTMKIITIIDGKTSIKRLDKGKISSEEGLVSPIDTSVAGGDVGATAICYKFDVFDGVNFYFRIWTEPKNGGHDNLWKGKFRIWLAGYKIYEYLGTWYPPSNIFDPSLYIKSVTLTVTSIMEQLPYPLSLTGLPYSGWCWGKDDDEIDTDLFDGESETGSASCSGYVTPTPYIALGFGCLDPYITIYDDEIAVHGFVLQNAGNLFTETFTISYTQLDFATSSISTSSVTLSPDQSAMFSITTDPFDLGTGTFAVYVSSIIYATIKDTDGNYHTFVHHSWASAITCTLEVIDDDEIPPVITWVYDGDYTDGNPGNIIVTASDASGLAIDPSGTYPVLDNRLGLHWFPFYALDNDSDRPDDKLSQFISVPINILDDDIEKPYFKDLMITDDHLWLNISFTGIDDLQLLGDGDEGLSNVEVYVDDNLIHSDSSSTYETVFDFSHSNDWIWVPGIHNIQIDITDADDDRILFNEDDSESNTIYGIFEVTLDEMYQYVMWLCEEMNNYIYDNNIVALYGVVTQKLVKIQALLWEAYQLIQDGYLHTGLVRQKMAEIKLEIADTKTELMINKQSMSQEYFDHLQECIRDVRNRIVELMGLGIDREFSYDIALVEIDVYNLRDFVEDNINATDAENIVNSITLTAEKLENAIFDISLDKSTERSLISALNALDNVRIEVIALEGKGKISEVLKLALNAIIIPLQARIDDLIPII